MLLVLGRVDQGSLNYLFWGDQTMQIYGHFEKIPLYKCIVWVGDIMIPVDHHDS